MKETIKDFMGQELNTGDYVVVSQRTYSKTDYLGYGQIIEIEDPVYYQNGKLNHVDLLIKLEAKSDDYRCNLEDCNYKQDLGEWVVRFSYSDKCYVSILKVNKIQ